MAKKDQTPAAKAAPAAATAPAEQQGNLPAGSTATTTVLDVGAVLVTNTEQTKEAPGADAAPTVVEPTASTTGQDAQLDQEGQGDGAQAQLNQGDTTGLELVAGASVAPADVGGHSVEDSDADDLGDGEIEGLWIRAVPEQGFRRLGMRFTREGHGVALSALTDDQVEALFSDPNLTVEHGFFSGLVE
ncbi:MAG TPA: hypothetical protein PK873_14230 [Pseudomonas sp.]|uniref:hypothetical protein n=1 Tax=Pseudomonas sp. TaxID=306 RepID=UPI002CAFE410|nr:hypothetical protein [Pseudomonas sp.]HRL94706.1 hypothetical protein [Pseudomonas sp.]